MVACIGSAVITVVLWFTADSADRPVILRVGLVTALTGLAEPLFVPDYWNPPTLFDLGQRTGFDIESFLQNFTAGANATAIYGAVRRRARGRAAIAERDCSRNRYHRLTLAVFPLVFIGLVVATNMNAIHITMVAVSAGFLATCLARPDLIRLIITSAILFTGLYFAFFLAFNAVYPGYLDQVWNLGALSGVLIVGVPLEEVVFALGYGLIVACFAEHFFAWMTVNRADADDLV
jgi:Lycopene cyclase